MKDSGDNFGAFPIAFRCFSSDSPEFLHMAFLIPLRNVAPMFYSLLRASFAIKTNDYGQDLSAKQ